MIASRAGTIGSRVYRIFSASVGCGNASCSAQREASWKSPWEPEKTWRIYPRDCRVIAVDLSNEMLNIARKRAAKLAIQVSFLLADAEALPFCARSFDTVISSLSTCTFPDPLTALKEMRRVCRPEGRILLLEHGRSDREWLGHFQDRNADKFAKPLGCHWNREPLDLVQAAGLHVIEAQRVFFGVFHRIEAAPAGRRE